MELKVGDKVKVVKKFEDDVDYEYEIASEMLNLQGKEVTISRIITKNAFNLKEDSYNYTWSTAMFDLDEVVKPKRVYNGGFKIGTRVKSKEFGNGTIICFKNGLEDCGVEFDDMHKGFHSCYKRGKEGHCYWFYKNSKEYQYGGEKIEIIEDDENIVIENIEKNGDEMENSKLEDIKKTLEKTNELLKESQKTNKFEEAIINGIVEHAKKVSTEDIKREIIDFVKNFVKDEYGKLPTVIEVVKDGKRIETEGLFHKDYEKILKIVDQKIPLILVGPAGSGKNHTLEQVAKTLGLDFYFTNSVTQEYKLTGFIDAGGKYHETEFYKAFKNGGLFFFDEIDASCSESIIVVNAGIANGYFDFPNGRINAHEDFRVVAAANTYGNGADMIYVGRNQLDGATLDRFVTLEFDYDENVERALCGDESLYDFVIGMRKAIKSRNLRFIVSMRTIINASKLLASGIDKKTIVKTVITKSMTKDDINTIVNEISVSNDWTTALKSLK